jgi:isopenicillin N synthase-like dioxygenase
VGISTVLMRLHEALEDLQRRFLRVIAIGIGCAETFFEEMVREAPTLSRAIHYPPMAAVPGEGHLWSAAHDDINLITALPRATAAGLQVLVEGRWVKAIPPADRVIINSGLMLERLSNGVIPAGRHRVVCPADLHTDRLSVVQFCHPRPWTVLAPLPSCCGPDHPQRYCAVTAAAALEEMLHTIRLLDPPPASPEQHPEPGAQP